MTASLRSPSPSRVLDGMARAFLVSGIRKIDQGRRPNQEDLSQANQSVARSTPRVSTEQGLDQDFDSLDAQYEAASAYIKSQEPMPVGLRIRSRYDDGLRYSGVQPTVPTCCGCWKISRARKIDVIVVYKVDRLTRSLADFAKMVELFDANAGSRSSRLLSSLTPRPRWDA